LKGRFINLLLATCQITGPIVLQFSLITVISQEPSLGQITKAFVTLGFVVGIDDMFAKDLPAEVQENTDRLNASNKLIIKKDYNTFGLIFERIILRLRYKWFCCCRSKKLVHWWKKHGENNPSVLYEIGNIFINLLYFTVVAFKSIIFSYYTGILCLGCQFAGFYYNMIF